MRFSRRAMLTGMGAALATGTRADAPLTSMRPRAHGSLANPSAQIIAASGLTGQIGFVIADAVTGEVLDHFAPDRLLPPASVTKAVTACYAMTALGAGHQFETRFIADGEIKNGILDGNLILAGGGDPNLQTDDLAVLASRLKDSGLKEVRGDFLVWDKALVNLAEIDGTQLDHVGYNPSVGGLNLNFNRVHFEWKQQGADISTALDARSENFRPVVKTARVQITDRQFPVFTYRAGQGVDEWTVARAALQGEGSRWLPVRHPALYAGEVVATFARSHGIVLKYPRKTETTPQGTVLAAFQSAPLSEMIQGMLRYSTNITAEAMGLSATKALTGQMRGLRSSAMDMARWAQVRTGGAPFFADHSGLGDTSRLSVAEMVGLLNADGIRPMLSPLLRTIPMVDAKGRALSDPRAETRAKTGTLNFVASLAGYLGRDDGRDLTFAFFSADIPAREAGKRSGAEIPPGARAWNTRAKRLQQQLLQYWATG
ncbi:D-alanyl-D-alanine carboxypeptidase/D-alanyl-D-alanine endopeptidase [Yoonia sp.]|uniref:D-alanyl-D-alanine carboxypeptidase/D-alanyl-D-alanine endopeptidase n=1 Tax=Yoonia sp. TaxID=2212373 RepID=UPI003F6DA052